MIELWDECCVDCGADTTVERQEDGSWLRTCDECGWEQLIPYKEVSRDD